MSNDAKRTTTTADGTSMKRTATSFGDISATGAAMGPKPTLVSSDLKVTLEVGGKDPVCRTFAPGDVLVGRRPSNDLVIDGEGLKVVSGFHLRFAFESGRWCIEDKNSTNGTYINGIRAKGLQAVRDGDVVELGRQRKQGTYRAVKLTVALTGAAAAQATADFLPSQVAPKTVDSSGERAVPAAPETIVASPKDAPKSALESGIHGVKVKGATTSKDGSTVVPAPKSGATPGPAAKPTVRPAVEPAERVPIKAAKSTSAPAKKVPAVHPSGIRALIGQVQEKSRRLGEVSYRLDAYVEDLASASVERHVALGIAHVPGGTAVIDLIAKEERLNATLQSLETELPSVRTRLEDELAPLERSAALTKEASDKAAAQFKRSAKRRDEGLAALKTAFAEATSALRTTLAPVVEVMDEERASKLSASPGASLDPATDEPVWKYWSVALQSGMEEISSREEELAAIRAEAADADDLAKTAEAEAKDAEAKWSAARKEADDRRVAIENSVTEKEAVFAETTAQIGAVRESMGATAKEFILSILGAPESASGNLSSLAGMKDARKLFQEVEGLRQELNDLESGAY